MAEKLKIVESFLSCHVCSEIFKDPVSLSCNHSFCQSCISKLWSQANNRNCPVCKRKSSKDDPDVNFSLKGLADSYAGRIQKKEEPGESEEVVCSKGEPGESEEVVGSNGEPGESEEVLCSKHSKNPKWFCMDEEKAVCSDCESPTHHAGHTIKPLEEAVLDMKGTFKLDIKQMQDQLKKYTDIGKKYKGIIQHTKRQLAVTEGKIKEEFEKLHQFLREEEEARLAALREEEEQKRKTISGEMKMIQEQIHFLTACISGVEEELQKEDLLFLKNYKHTGIRAQCSLQDPQLVSGALIDVAKHLGNLKFRVWEKMLETVQHTPVILDPNTAADWLSLSDDLTSVRYTDTKQKLPDNPERFMKYAVVLGSEGFTSGKHSWEVEVEVGDATQWDVGVAKESVDRKGVITTSPKYGFWAAYLREGEEYKADGKTLTLKRKPERIRVQLDYDRGEVSFYDPSHMTHIYTYKDTFTERLFPYFFIFNDGNNSENFQICPSKVSLVVKSVH